MLARFDRRMILLAAIIVTLLAFVLFALAYGAMRALP
jgi:hypothetical protein